MMPDGSGTEPETIPEAVAAVCELHRDRVALQIAAGSDYRRYTYGKLVDMVGGLSRALARHGLRSGGRAAILAENRPEWVVAYLGIVAAGGTVVPLDAQLSGQELARLLARSRSRFVFVSARTCSLLGDLPEGPTAINLDTADARGVVGLNTFMEEEAGASGPADQQKILPGDIASLLYTSGTTGEPKGGLLSHRNLVSNAQALIASGLGTSADNFLAVLPLHHAYPFMVSCLVPLLLGARVTFLQTLKGPELVQCVRETQVTFLVGVPQLFAMMRRAISEEIARRPRVVRGFLRLLMALSGLIRGAFSLNLGKIIFARLHRRFGASLRVLSSGGARLDPEVARDFYRLGFTLLEGYGLTETAPAVTFNPVDRPKFGSVGVPIHGVAVRIVNPDAAGVGEVAVKGPNVMQGYDDDPRATAQTIREGWLYTGDLGYLDRDGYLFLTGRTSELIVTAGGKNIDPEELEAQYLASQAIAELCVVGVKRAGEGGEGLHAVVVPNLDYLKTQKIPDGRQHIRDELARIGQTLPSYRRITGFSISKASLPRTRLGKIQRYRVAALLAGEEQPSRERPALSAADRALLEDEVGRRVVAALRPLVSRDKPIFPDDHLDLDLGLDSLRRVEFVAALERGVGPLPEAFATQVTTVREVIERLASPAHRIELGATETRSWREILQEPPPRDFAGTLLSAPPWHHRPVASLARIVVRSLLQTVFGLEVAGLQHLPREGPLVLASNHVSYFDPFVVLAAVPSPLFSRLYCVGWQTYFQGAFLAWVGRVGRVIPVGWDASSVAVLRTEATLLRRGQALLIFPEGRRAVNGELNPFQEGIGVLACELGVPVIPVRLRGTFEVLPVGAWWPRLHRIAITFGSPVTVTQDRIERWRADGKDPHEAATGLIHGAIQSLAEAV